MTAVSQSQPETKQGVDVGTNKAQTTVTASSGNADGAIRRKCGPDCVKPTPSQAHCAVCHQTFGGVTGFDHHRRDGQCIQPAGLGMELSALGIWRTPMSPDAIARLAATER